MVLLTHSLTHSLTYLLTHSPTYLLTYLLTHSLGVSTNPFDLRCLRALFLAGERADPDTIRWCQQVLRHTPGTHSLTYSLTYSLTHSLTHQCTIIGGRPSRAGLLHQEWWD